MLRRFLRSLGSVGGGFCAGFLAFAAVFGAIGLAVARPFSPEKTCWPHYSAIYVFETYCANEVANWAWFGTVELARYAVAMPALALYHLQEALLGPVYFFSLIDSFVWTLAVIICLLVWAGFGIGMRGFRRLHGGSWESSWRKPRSRRRLSTWAHQWRRLADLSLTSQ